MATGKRYYWLKLKEDFFNEIYVKALRQLPQGDSLVIVYLKMQLKSLKTEGIIDYKGIMPNNIAELALALDEKEDVVKRTVETLVGFGVIEQWENESFYMVAMQALIGSEGASAERVRKHRALQSNTSVTESKEIEKEIELDIEAEQEKERRDSVPQPLTNNKSMNNSFIFSLPLRDGTSYPVTQGKLSEWENTYPNIDIKAQLNRIAEWATNESTNGISPEKADSFIVKWLSEEQEKAKRSKGTKSTAASNTSSQYDFAEIERLALERRITKHRSG